MPKTELQVWAERESLMDFKQAEDKTKGHKGNVDGLRTVCLCFQLFELSNNNDSIQNPKICLFAIKQQVLCDKVTSVQFVFKLFFYQLTALNTRHAAQNCLH